MPKKSKLRDLLEFFALFMLLYLLTQFALKTFFPNQFGGNGQTQTGVVLFMQDQTVKGGHHPIAILQNHTEKTLELPARCPMPPVDVYMVGGGERRLLTTDETVLPCKDLGPVEPGKKVQIDLAPWKYSLFGEFGTYELILTLTEAEKQADEPEAPAEETPQKEVASTEFVHYPAGSVTKAFRAFITKPLLNLLILIASYAPGYNLGIAIILLTILVKLLLFIPTQHGLEGQKRLQKVQPHLDAVKQKHKNDPQRLQQETMKIWKEYKVNPFQSCLPILIQFPILIGLFFVIRDGSTLELSRHLIYAPYQHLSWSFGTGFLGLDLTMPSKLIFPPLLVILQFAQMKLSFAIAKKKDGKSDKKLSKEKESAQQMQQKMMLYGLPLMIGFFALQFPAAVSLYWGVSTIFAVGQQLVVNRKTL